MSADDLEEARAGFKQASDAKQDADAFAKLSPGAASPGYIKSTNALFVAAKLALKKVEAMVSETIGNNAQKQAVTPTAPKAPAAPVRTVNINLGGRHTAINVASQADSDAPVGLLRGLAAAAGTAQ